MGSGVLGLSIGKTALQSHQRALEATSQNLANANTEGYSRKVVTMKAIGALNLPDVIGPSVSSQIGLGVNVARIESVRDTLLNARMRDMKGQLQENDRKRQILDQVEALFAGEIDIADAMDDFFSALDDLSTQPDSLTVRSVVRARGEEMSDLIRFASDSVDDIRADLNSEVEDIAVKINAITTDLASLNEKIAAMTSADLSPNDYEDQRQVLLEELAEFGNVQTIDSEAGALTVLFGGQVVVQAFQANTMTVESSNDIDEISSLRVASGPNGLVEVTTGILKGLKDLQEEDIAGVSDDLDELAIYLTHRFNSIHSTGFGLDGSTKVNFFTYGNPLPTETDLFSVTGSVFVPDTGIALDGLTTTTQPENFESNPIGTGSIVINGNSISYNGAVDTLQNIVDRINLSRANVSASITPENRLTITATRQTDFVISNMADGGNLLARLGILPTGTAYPPTLGVMSNPTSVFTGTVTVEPPADAASRLTLTDDVRNDLNKIAAAKGDDLTDPPDGIGNVSRGPGDGANALLLSQLRSEQVMSRGTATFNDFYVATLGNLGVEAGAAKRMTDGLQAQFDQLEQRRQEIQGVSIDEELINMIKYQRGFQAAARIINTMDEVLQTLLTLAR